MSKQNMLEKLRININQIFKNGKIPLELNPFLSTSGKIGIAVSGGADSICLAILLHQLNVKVLALIVDHKLQENSSEIAQLTKKKLESAGIDSKILTWNHPEINTGMEEKARVARYELLTLECKNNQIEQLYVAHHMNDQVETFFINLARGSGLDGLSSMKSVVKKNDIFVIRPMLNFSKSEIFEFLRKESFEWYEDPTNEDRTIQRNAIRAALSSFQDGQLLQKRIFAAIGRIQDACDMLERYVDKIFTEICLKISDDEILLVSNKYKTLQQPEKIYILNKAIMMVAGRVKKGRLLDLERLLREINNTIKGKRTLMKTIIHWDEDFIKIYPEKSPNRNN